MAGEDIIMATREELKWLPVMGKGVEKVIKQGKGAEILSLSLRQVRRLGQQLRVERALGTFRKNYEGNGFYRPAALIKGITAFSLFIMTCS
jgi:hypothetical protein